MKKGLLYGIIAIISMITIMSFTVIEKKRFLLCNDTSTPSLFDPSPTQEQAEQALQNYISDNGIKSADIVNKRVFRAYLPDSWFFQICFWTEGVVEISATDGNILSNAFQNGEFNNGLLPMAVEECGFSSESDAVTYANNVKAVLKNQPVTNVTVQFRSIPGPPGGYGTYYCAAVYWELPIFD